MPAVDTSSKVPTNESHDHTPIEGRAMRGERNSAPDSERRSITASSQFSRQSACGTTDDGVIDYAASGDTTTPRHYKNVDEATNHSANSTSTPLHSRHSTEHGRTGYTKYGNDSNIQNSTPVVPSEDRIEASNDLSLDSPKLDLQSNDERLKELQPTFSSVPSNAQDGPFSGNYVDRPTSERTVPGAPPVFPRGVMGNHIPRGSTETAGLDPEALEKDEADDDVEWSEWFKMLDKALMTLAESKKSKGRD